MVGVRVGVVVFVGSGEGVGVFVGVCPQPTNIIPRKSKHKHSIFIFSLLFSAKRC
jgi:hypothetical protein